MTLSLMPRMCGTTTADRYKGQAGKIGTIGGCREYTGAPYFASIAALKARIIIFVVASAIGILRISYFCGVCLCAAAAVRLPYPAAHSRWVQTFRTYFARRARPRSSSRTARS